MNLLRPLAIHLSALSFTIAGVVAASTSSARAQLLPGATCFPNVFQGYTCIKGEGASRQFVETYAGYPAPLGGPNGPVGNILMKGNCSSAPVTAIFVKAEGARLSQQGYCTLSIQEIRDYMTQKIQSQNQQAQTPWQKSGYPSEISCRRAMRSLGRTESACW